MRLLAIPIVAFVLGGLLCLPSVRAEAPEMTDTPYGGTRWQRLQKEWTDLLDALSDYTAETQHRAMQETQRLLALLDQQAALLQDYLERHWSELSEQGRRQAQEALEALQRQREALARWYERMEGASEEQWAQAKRAFERAYESAKRAIDRLLNDYAREREPQRPIPAGPDDATTTPI